MDIGKQLLECLKYKNASNKIEELDEKGLLELALKIWRKSESADIT